MTVIPIPVPGPVPVDFSPIERLIKKITDAIDRMFKGFRAFVSVFEKALRAIQTASLGLASGVVNACIKAFNWISDMAEQMARALQEVLDFLTAPWAIKAVGDTLQDEVFKASNDLAQSLNKEELAAAEEWSGDGAEGYFSSVDKQGSAATGVGSGIKDLASGMRALGWEAIAATISFAVATAAAIVGLIASLVALTPPATPLGATGLAAIITAELSLIVALVALGISQAKGVDSLRNALQDHISGSAFPGGRWPAGLGTGADSNRQQDASRKDGDADWSRDLD